MAPTTPFDTKLFRQTMGRFATGVTVITIAQGDQARGMTANAFMSVSLDPPLVLASIARRARLNDLLALGQRYGVSILSDDQEALSRHFGGQPNSALEISLIWHDGTPLLRGAVAHIVAEVVDVHAAGDHTLFIGEVKHLSLGTGRPLLFYAGLYGHLSSHDLHPVPEVTGWIGL